MPRVRELATKLGAISGVLPLKHSAKALFYIMLDYLRDAITTNISTYGFNVLVASSVGSIGYGLYCLYKIKSLPPIKDTEFVDSPENIARQKYGNRLLMSQSILWANIIPAIAVYYPNQYINIPSVTAFTTVLASIPIIANFYKQKLPVQMIVTGVISAASVGAMWDLKLFDFLFYNFRTCTFLRV